MRRLESYFLLIGLLALIMAGAAFAFAPQMSNKIITEHPYLKLDTHPDVLEKHARKGDEFAQFALGRAYYLGEGVPKNTHRALFLFEQAANQGYVPAQFLAARIHSQNKQAIHQDLAMYWFERAANAGLKEAQYHLSQMTLQRQSAVTERIVTVYQ